MRYQAHGMQQMLREMDAMRGADTALRNAALLVPVLIRWTEPRLRTSTRYSAIARGGRFIDRILLLE